MNSLTTNRSILIYDIEIARAIMPSYSKSERDLIYCSGWDDYANMGISIIGTYDYLECRSRAFLQHNLQAFQKLVENYEFIVGFDNHNFGNRLLAANNISLSPKIGSYDLLEGILRAAGIEYHLDKKPPVGFSLDEIAQANLGIAKKVNPALMPIWFQRGQMELLINGCIADVWLIKRLLDLVLKDELFFDPRHNSRSLKVQKP